MIKEIAPNEDFAVYSELLKASFATVAAEFGLTKENSPTNNAFITPYELKNQLERNKKYYCYWSDNIAIGFVAIEKSKSQEGVFYIEKLAVHPLHRHKSIGLKLMDFATRQIAAMGGKRISIGLIEANTRLKKWYAKQGFVETGICYFDHLPFDVCYMAKDIPDKTEKA